MGQNFLEVPSEPAISSLGEKTSIKDAIQIVMYSNKVLSEIMIEGDALSQIFLRSGHANHAAAAEVLPAIVSLDRSLSLWMCEFRCREMSLIFICWGCLRSIPNPG